MNTSLLDQLQELHIPLNESKVFLALSSHGGSSAGDLIKKTQLHRAVVYESLDRLIEKKLVWKLTKNHVAFFQPADPARLLQRSQNEMEIARNIAASLRLASNMKSPEIMIYEGIESYRRFWLDATSRLPVGATDYVAGSIGTLWHTYMGRDAEKLLKIRIKRKIKWKMILFGRDKPDLNLLQRYPRLHEYRIIEKGVSREGNFNIMGKEAVLLHSATEPMIIEVKSKSLVRVFQNLFDILWVSGKKVSADR